MTEHRVWSLGFVESYSVVNITQGERTTNRRQLNQAFEQTHIRQQPTSISLFEVLFHPVFLLREEQVFRERFNRTIVGGLPQTIVSLCGFSRYFDNQSRIKQSIKVIIFKLRLATNYNHIGVDI